MGGLLQNWTEPLHLAAEDWDAERGHRSHWEVELFLISCICHVTFFFTVDTGLQVNIKISLSTFMPDISEFDGHAFFLCTWSTDWYSLSLCIKILWDISQPKNGFVWNILLLSGLAHAKVRSTDMQVEKEDLGKRASARKGLSNVTVGLGSSFKMFIWGNSVRVGFKGLKEVLYNAEDKWRSPFIRP